MKDTSDDGQLIAAAISGDDTAFKSLVERHEGKIAGIVKSILGDCPEAGDVGQEVFIRFYESMDRFKGDAALGTYLARIAINLSLNELKRRKKKSHVFQPLDLAKQVRGDENDDDETLQLLHQQIAHLDPEFNAVLTLRLIQGYSTEETSEILKIPAGTVLSRLFRAQKKLKEVLFKHKQL